MYYPRAVLEDNLRNHQEMIIYRGPMLLTVGPISGSSTSNTSGLSGLIRSISLSDASITESFIRILNMHD